VAGARPNIWQLQSRRDISGLIDALRYPDPEVRKRAAVALRTLDATQAVPALKAASRQETDSRVQANLRSALHVLDHRTDITALIQTKDVPGLIKALNSRRPAHAVAAARALGKLGDRIAVEPLVILFHNPASTPEVRLAAAEALLELKSAPAVVTLLGALRRESWQVRRNAAAVLGQIQATWAVKPLAAALQDPHPVVRRTAAAALRRIGTVEAVAALRGHFTPQAVAGKEQRETAQKQKAATPPVPAARKPRTEQARSTAQPARRKLPPRPAVLPEEPKQRPAAASEKPAKPKPLQATPEPTSADTVPVETTPAETEPSEQPSRITRPVRRLISFFTKTDDEDE
jgi:HEAT repeat protein